MKLLKIWLFKFSDAFESKRDFVIIRRGLTAATPLIIIGAMALMLTSLPIPAYQDFITSVFGGSLATILSLIYDACFNMLSIYMIIVISYNSILSNSGDTNEAIIASLISIASYCVLNGNIISGKATSVFDCTQLFSAIICALVSSRLYQIIRNKCFRRERYVTLNGDIVFADAIKSIFPAVVIIILFSLINEFITTTFDVYSIQGLFTLVAQKIFSYVGNGYFSMLLYTFLVQFLWFFGIHGSNVLEPIIQSNYIEVGTNIFSKSFYDTFVNMGGSGVCLCLIIGLIIFSKTKEIRYVTKLGTLPVLFNISEIISIGLPLLFNPIFLVPFLLVPVINGAISYFTTYIGLVPLVTNDVTWTTPVLFSGYYATNSYAGSVLQIFLLFIGVLLYAPFIITYEERLKSDAIRKVADLVAHMEECEQKQVSPDFLKRNDILGQTAKILAHELKDALDNNCIYYKYQPIMDSSGHCIGCEALIRWDHSVVGHIYPPLIIELAKEAGLSKEVDRILIHNACELIRAVEAECHCNVKVSINLTVASLLDNHILDIISNTLYRYGITPSSLSIELTENEVFTNVDKVSETLDVLYEKGHQLIIDDFGMGHTSIKYLQANKFNIVKLDRSLIKDIVKSDVNQKIISSISNLGNTLGFQIVAEAVENSAQYKKLSELGCHYYQGYLYSKPLTAEEFVIYYNRHIYLRPHTSE